ncbi:hypothetical protein CTI12_AA422910 [Artemisia annua]|uniref:Tetratricopeptide repeat (TPR)-like superfamily protein n=1 Tax=Artemisia annua TaxID=35608 RepID=A0A2U1M3X9_ARTAN|nr:hypothetical protein CTI12_AA422910 [Artemisia annua]
MHKLPRIWTMYLKTLTEQKIVTRTRRTFDRALCALPVTQHDRIWELYLVFVRQSGVPIETSCRVYRRYLMYYPGHIEDLIEFLLSSGLWQEAAERLAGVLNDDRFWSIKGKTWLELCDLLTNHASEISGLNVDAIIRGGISKFSDDVGRLWTSLADYYIRRKLLEKARDVFEEGMMTVVTVRDFSVIFYAYLQFEETRLEHLMDRRPQLANSVLLRQNPHNVEQWHRRVKIFEGNPTKQILTYTEAVRTIDPMKAVGKPHTLWVAFAKLYETHKDVANARVILDKAVQVNYKAVDNLASVWCEWAEMELRHKNFKGALELMRRATAEPSAEQYRDYNLVHSDEKDVDLRIARLEHLMDRRPQLANSVLLRQNPHTVKQWHRRVKIFEGNPTKQILTYTEAVRTIDPMKAVGKPHTLWVAFAKLYETHKDVANARVILDKAVQVNYKAVDNLASVWCEWAEMELRHKNFKGALELMRRATAE